MKRDFSDPAISCQAQVRILMSIGTGRPEAGKDKRGKDPIFGG
jgi:hypothetical protein